MEEPKKRGRPPKNRTPEEVKEDSKKRIMVRRLKTAPIETIIERIKLELEVLENRLKEDKLST